VLSAPDQTVDPATVRRCGIVYAVAIDVLELAGRSPDRRRVEALTLLRVAELLVPEPGNPLAGDRDLRRSTVCFLLL